MPGMSRLKWAESGGGKERGGGKGEEGEISDVAMATDRGEGAVRSNLHPHIYIWGSTCITSPPTPSATSLAHAPFF
jgi:hypothetical protein